MRIVIGTGNDITVAFTASAKTLAFSGAYMIDIQPANLQIYNSTRSAFMWGGGSAATMSGGVTTYTAGLPVQTFTLSAIPASAANGDTLVILLEVPDSIATFLATMNNT